MSLYNIFECLNPDGIVPTLEDCAAAGYRPAFMPELIRERLAQPKLDKIWQNWWTSASLIASGRTKQGTYVKVIAHVPHAFLKPKTLGKVLKHDLKPHYSGIYLQRNLTAKGAGKYPQADFNRLLNLAEQGKEGVFVIPEETFTKADLNTIVWGVTESEAKKYLVEREKKFGPGWCNGYADMASKEPVGRLVYLGYCYGNADGVEGGIDLSGRARVFGVRASDSEQDSPAGRGAKNDFQQHYAALLADPERAVKALDDQKAAALMKVLSQYMARKVEKI
ncbi:MAG: hypothetical protein AABW48_01455 [Nanoarchaeota archaeon]